MYLPVNLTNFTCLDNHLTTPRIVIICSYAIVIIETLLILVAMGARRKIFHSNLYMFVASMLAANLLSALSGLILQFVSSLDVSNRAVSIAKGINYGGIILLSISLCFVNMSVRFTYSRFTDVISNSFLSAKNTNRRNLDMRLRVLFRSKKIAMWVIIISWIFAVCLMILPLWLMCTVSNGLCFMHCIGHVKAQTENGTELLLLACDESKCNMYMQPLKTSYILILLSIAYVCVLILIVATISAVCVKIKIVPNPANVNQMSIQRNATPNEDEPDSSVYVRRSTSLNDMVAKRYIAFNHDIMARFALFVTAAFLVCWLPILTGLTASSLLKVHLFTVYDAEYLTILIAALEFSVPLVCAVMLGGLKNAMISFYTCTTFTISTRHNQTFRNVM